MSNAIDEHLRDARRAHGELAVSLSTLTEKLTEARAAASTADLDGALRSIDGAVREIEAAHGYLAAARDEWQALSRAVGPTKVSE